MAAHPLAAVVTLGEFGLTASHIPLVHEDNGSEFGVLKGHVSRANMQWKDPCRRFRRAGHFLRAAALHLRRLGIPAKQEHGKEKSPTWNYVVVHADGPLRNRQ